MKIPEQILTESNLRQYLSYMIDILGWGFHPDDYIGVLVNNAGIRKDNLMIFMQNDEWHQVMDTSLNAFFYITRRLLKNMLTHRHGRIINMT